MKSKRYIDSFRKADRESAQKKADEIIEAQCFNEVQKAHLEKLAAEWVDKLVYFSEENIEDEEFDKPRLATNKIIFLMEQYIAGIESERLDMDMNTPSYIVVYFLAKAFYEAEEKEA